MRKLIALAVLVVGGCTAEVTAVEFAPNARELLPIPEQYRQSWAELEACLGIRGDIETVRFFVDDNRPVNKMGYRAGANRERRWIVFQQEARQNKTTVKHEMTHIMANASAHEPPWFRNECGNHRQSEGLYPIPIP